MSYYSNRRLMSYDRNNFPYRIVVGNRGWGKTFSMQNLICNHYKAYKNVPEGSIDDMFLWIRLTPRAIDKMKDRVIDDKLRKKHKIDAKVIDNRIYFNDKLVGHALALADAPVIKGGVWEWHRYKYVIIDEFQRERRERRTFDLVYNLTSVLESVTRFSTRIREGLDFPYVIFMGNTIDEATDILYKFDFLPLKYGFYKLKSKMAIIEYGGDSKQWQEDWKRNPLRILTSADDLTFGDKYFKQGINVVDPYYVGHKNYIAHLHLTDYIRVEVWSTQKGMILITKDHPVSKYDNKHFVLDKYGANKGTFYNLGFHLMIREAMYNNNLYFDKRITGQIFNKYVI